MHAVSESSRAVWWRFVVVSLTLCLIVVAIGSGVGQTSDALAQDKSDASAQVDLCVLADLTASAGPELDQLRQLWLSLEDLGSAASVEYGAVGYGDYPQAPYGFSDEVPYQRVAPIGPWASFTEAIAELTLGRGGDPSEAQLDAIVAAVGPTTNDCGWRAGTQRIMVANADSPCHDVGLTHQFSVSAVSAVLTNSDTTFVGLVDGDGASECFGPLANATGGELVAVNADLDDFRSLVAALIEVPETETPETEETEKKEDDEPVVLRVVAAQAIAVPTDEVLGVTTAAPQSPPLAATGGDVMPVAAVAMAMIALGGACSIAARHRSEEEVGATERDASSRKSRLRRSLSIGLLAALVASVTTVANTWDVDAEAQIPDASVEVDDYAPGSAKAQALTPSYFDKTERCRDGMWRIADQDLVPGVYWVDCDVELLNSEGEITIIATGQIRVGGDDLAFDGFEGEPLFVARDGVAIESNNSRFDAPIIATDGRVSDAGQGNVFDCVIDVERSTCDDNPGNDTGQVSVTINALDGFGASLQLDGIADNDFVVNKPLGGATTEVEITVPLGTYRVIAPPLFIDGVRYVASLSDDGPLILSPARPDASLVADYQPDGASTELSIIDLDGGVITLGWEGIDGANYALRRTDGEVPAPTVDDGLQVSVDAMTATDSGLQSGADYTYSLFTRFGNEEWIGPFWVTAGFEESPAMSVEYVKVADTLVAEAGDITAFDIADASINVELVSGLMAPPIGGTVVLPVSDELPGGFIGEVAEVSTDGTQIVLSSGEIPGGFDYYELSVPSFAALPEVPEPARRDLTPLRDPGDELCSVGGEKGVSIDTDVDFDGHFDYMFTSGFLDIPTGVVVDVGVAITATVSVDLETTVAYACGLPLKEGVARFSLGPVPMLLRAGFIADVELEGTWKAENYGFAVESAFDTVITANGDGVSATRNYDGDVSRLDSKLSRSGATLKFRVGGALEIGPGVDVKGAGVIAGISGSVFPVQVRVEAEGDGRPGGSGCVTAAVETAAEVGLIAEAFLGPFSIGFNAVLWEGANQWWEASDCQDLSISDADLRDGSVNRPYSGQLTAEGGRPPYQFRVADDTPGPLRISDDGLITGTPTTEGEVRLVVEVNDARGDAATKVLTIRVGPECPTEQTTSRPPDDALELAVVGLPGGDGRDVWDLPYEDTACASPIGSVAGGTLLFGVAESRSYVEVIRRDGRSVGWIDSDFVVDSPVNPPCDAEPVTEDGISIPFVVVEPANIWEEPYVNTACGNAEGSVNPGATLVVTEGSASFYLARRSDGTETFWIKKSRVELSDDNVSFTEPYPFVCDGQQRLAGTIAGFAGDEEVLLDWGRGTRTRRAENGVVKFFWVCPPPDGGTESFRVTGDTSRRTIRFDFRTVLECATEPLLEDGLSFEVVVRPLPGPETAEAWDQAYVDTACGTVDDRLAPGTTLVVSGATASYYLARRTNDTETFWIEKRLVRKTTVDPVCPAEPVLEDDLSREVLVRFLPGADLAEVWDQPYIDTECATIEDQLAPGTLLVASKSTASYYFVQRTNGTKTFWIDKRLVDDGD